MPEILQWNQLPAEFKQGTLLLGNGASIAVHDGFRYPSLCAEAEQQGHFSPEIVDVFRAFGTDDFELVLRRLWQASLVNHALDIDAGKVETSYQHVREALIATVRDIHISYEDASRHFEVIYRFLSGFETVLSLNYDLIVYWSMLASKSSLGNWFKDCFQEGGHFREDWETLREHYKANGSTLVFYPHGNLITVRCDDFSEKKLAAGSSEKLLDKFLERWKDGSVVPLFVSEGTSGHKKRAIASSSYLSQVFAEVIPSVSASLVIYGWSMSDQDQHIIDQLKRAKALVRIAVSVYRNDQQGAERMQNVLSRLGVKEIVFFDAESPGCWIYPQAAAT